MPIRLLVTAAMLAIAFIYLIKAVVEKRRCEACLAAAHLFLAAVTLTGAHDAG